jgi:hypothetical protein
MKLHLLEDLLDLNQAFERVLTGLERMEKVPLFHRQEVRYLCAEVESARVQANREFFDQFEAIVEKDVRWAYKFRRAYDQKTKDPFDFYLEIKEREEARKKKGLPPRVVLLPDWDRDDEERYNQERAKKRKRTTERRKKTVRKHKPNSQKPQSLAQIGATPAPEGGTDR